MKEIIIKLTPFVFKQSVFIKDGRTVEEHKVPQTDLAKFISSYKNIDTVHFFGNEKMAKKIKDDCVTKYNVSRLTVKFMYNK